MIGKLTRQIFGMVMIGWMLAGCLASETHVENRLYDVGTGQVTAVSDVLPQLKEKGIVLVGEHHTNAGHHRAQLDVIRGLSEAGTAVAIGLEMFRSESQGALDRWVAGEFSETEFRGIFYDNWNYDWPLYRDIFLYARENRIPMVGLNVAKGITRQVARKGYQSLSADQIRKLGDVSCRVDQEYMDFIREAYGGHSHGDMGFLYFCEAQMVWDTAMAVNALDYLKASPDRVMVILAGTGHVRKQAIPYQIRRRSSVPMGVILPEVPGTIDSGRVDVKDADFIFLDLRSQ